MSNLTETSIQYVKGVGPARSKLFANLGVETIEDLLYFFPRRYEDRTKLISVSDVKVGEWQTITGEVLAGKARKSWHTKKHVFEASIGDKTGRIFGVWFNMPYLDKYFKVGSKVVLYGKVDLYKNRLQMISPEYEIIEDTDGEQLNIGRIVPMYPLTKGMTQRYLRKVIKKCVDKYKEYLNDVLPVAIRNKHRLSNIKRSISNIHFPESFKDQEAAMRRVSFEEFFFFQVSVILRRLSITSKKGYAHNIDDSLSQRFAKHFPFELTKSQVKVIDEISVDLKKEQPMLRLLQGDVGCGKTLVAFFACLVSFINKKQSAVMAPTEILAQQHYEKLTQIVKDGGPFKGMRVELLISAQKKKNRESILDKVAKGEVDVLVGTHALIQDEVVFRKLSVVIIDEQHKFGVQQRALLSKKGKNPDILVMTATPIPRTLCLTLYGDLDVSTINEMPKNRGKVKSISVDKDDVAKAYQFVKDEIKAKGQAYIVYPIVEESERLELKSAVEMHKYFQKNYFKNFRLGLIHGQMKRDEVNEVMHAFKEQKIDVLITTTVLEVGIDVANANCMVIEHAERFGLAQLHQLRGRIGRGKKDALCAFVANPQTAEGVARLDAIIKTRNGFKIAEKDLEIRGPGHFFGRHQHGLNELKVVNPLSQMDVLELARKEASEITGKDPKLLDNGNDRIKQVIGKRYPTYLANLEAG